MTQSKKFPTFLWNTKVVCFAASDPPSPTTHELNSQSTHWNRALRCFSANVRWCLAKLLLFLLLLAQLAQLPVWGGGCRGREKVFVCIWTPLALHILIRKTISFSLSLSLALSLSLRIDISTNQQEKKRTTLYENERDNHSLTAKHHTTMASLLSFPTLRMFWGCREGRREVGWCVCVGLIEMKRKRKKAR